MSALDLSRSASVDRTNSSGIPTAAGLPSLCIRDAISLRSCCDRSVGTLVFRPKVSWTRSPPALRTLRLTRARLTAGLLRDQARHRRVGGRSAHRGSGIPRGDQPPGGSERQWIRDSSDGEPGEGRWHRNKEHPRKTGAAIWQRAVDELLRCSTAWHYGAHTDPRQTGFVHGRHGSEAS